VIVAGKKTRHHAKWKPESAGESLLLEHHSCLSNLLHQRQGALEDWYT
jgi:hypothetical protein